MKAGFARACVNPPVGTPMQGLGQQGGCERIREDIFVQALFVAHDGETAVVIGSDLLFFDRPVADHVREAVADAAGTTADRVLLNFSHNHAGPVTGTWCYRKPPDPDYLAEVEAAIVDAVRRARAAQVEVSLSGGMTRCALPVNRRAVNEDGRAEFRPAPDAEVCDAVPVCVLRDADGAVVSVLFSASCHPSMWYALEICGDYPGVAARLLNERLGTEGALFLQGCGGDSKPAPIAGDGKWDVGSWADVEGAGRLLADAVLDLMEGEPTRFAPQLHSAATELVLPLMAAPSIEDLKAVLDDETERAERHAWAREMLDLLDRDGVLPSAVSVRIHALQLARGLRLIGLECEPVGEIGNVILRIFGDGVTFPLGYTDGTQLYLPTDHMLPEHGYEVDSYWEYHWPAPLAKGIDKQLEEVLLSLRDMVVQDI